ncbi:hypothetical protein [Ruegeria conchae]|uniref:Glucosyltransferase GtrII-like protein n=2 Tax=Ruegeria conchae TaxID=981384 RepID=A0A497ZAJ2_9RHOB|nr:hypothetical protein [Ruegeria conchae]RLK03565.1 hypothetical protein CLV75_2940 [Ruegeria conchae]
MRQNGSDNLDELQHRSAVGRYGSEWSAWAIFVGVAFLLQMFLALNTRAPFVIENGDNGSILYIIAHWIQPEAFMDDVLLGVDGTTSFYQAALMWPNYLLGLAGVELGFFYVIICFPIAMAQMGGFYLLGKQLFLNRNVAIALALISIPTVFTISGDLWGHYYSPLLRSAYGAALPWLLLILISPSRPRPYALMTAAAAASYLHLPSGPPVALALLFVSLLRRSEGQGWGYAFVHHVLAGVLYLALMSPYALLFSQTFAAGDKEALQQFANSPYANVGMAIDHLSTLRGVRRMSILISRVPGMEWADRVVVPFFGVLFVVGGLSLLVVTFTSVLPSHLRSRLSFSQSWYWVAGFFTTTIFLALGISAIDQAIAAAQARGPLQLDFIRATRFGVPATYIGMFMLITYLAQRFKPKASCLAPTCTIALAVWVWLFAYPSTSHGLYRMTKGQSIEDTNLTQFGQFSQKMAEIDGVGPITPVLRYDYLSSALRYVAFLPLTFNRKDNNFISYSGRLDSREHRALMDQIDAIRKARRDPDAQVPIITGFVDVLGSPDVVIDRRVVQELAEARLVSEYGFDLQLELGPFAYYRRAQ